MALNLVSAIELCGIFGPAMADQKMGSIINLSSTSGSLGTPFSAVYAATKGGINALTRALAAEYGLHRVRVNAVAPGPIVTEAWSRRVDFDEMRTVLERRVALRRWGTVTEVADVVSFLASDRSAYITGQIIVVDGGMSVLFEPIPRSADPTEG
jgi:gluconate 5-dehydrogenase